MEFYLFTPGRPRTTWMKTNQQDLRSNNLSLDEAITVAQIPSESSTLETDVCVWRYAPLVVHATQEEEEGLFVWLSVMFVHCAQTAGDIDTILWYERIAK